MEQQHQDSSSSSFTDAVEEQLERNRSKLRVLYHAAVCPHESTSPTNRCPIQAYCCAAKRLFVHINQCTHSDCEVPGCKHSRGVWKHYRKCRMNNSPQSNNNNNNGLVEEDYHHNTECSICSAVPVPYNPASLCPRFRVSKTASMGGDVVSSIAGGDSVGATFGGSDYQSVQVPQQQYARHVPSPQQAQSSVPTFAAQQSMAKLKGSLVDDGTVGTPSFPDAEKENVTDTATRSSTSSIRHKDPHYEATRGLPPSSAVTASMPRSKNRVSGVSCVMDAFETLMGSGQSSFTAAFPEDLNETQQLQQQVQQQYPHQLPSMMETANIHYSSSGKRNSRYQPLAPPSSSSGKNKSRFLSLRRNRSRDDDGEAAEPMIRHNGQYSMPSDEDDIRDAGDGFEGNSNDRHYKYPPQEQTRYRSSMGSRHYQEETETAAEMHKSSRGARIRRLQQRFLA